MTHADFAQPTKTNHKNNIQKITDTSFLYHQS